MERLLFVSERNVSVTSEHGHIQLTRDLSNSEETTQRVFQTKNECCLRSGDIKKGFLLDCSDKSDKIVRRSTFYSQWFNGDLQRQRYVLIESSRYHYLNASHVTCDCISNEIHLFAWLLNIDTCCDWLFKKTIRCTIFA